MYALFEVVLFIILSIVLVILLKFILMYYTNYGKVYELQYGEEESSKIPNIIYTYWDSPNVPLSVRKCIASWRKYNPYYKIIILNSSNYRQYIDMDIEKLRHADSKQRISDFVRLYILQKTGGIWLDASIMLYHSLDWLHAYSNKGNYEAVLYYLDSFSTIDAVINNKIVKKYPVVESWFIACVPNSTFISDWKEEFFGLNNYPTVKDYTQCVSKYTDLQNIPSREYLAIHCSCQEVLQKKNNYKLAYLCAEQGPYMYNTVMVWILPFLIFYPYIPCLHRPVVKFRGGERNYIEKLYKVGYHII